MNLQERIAARAIAHIPPGSVVNLGIGTVVSYCLSRRDRWGFRCEMA